MGSIYNQDFFNNLVLNPSESLSVEIKRWIDPQSKEGIAKIAKACIALRNNSALAQYVNQAVSPLFTIFNGYQLSIDAIEDLTRRLIERRL